LSAEGDSWPQAFSESAGVTCLEPQTARELISRSSQLRAPPTWRSRRVQEFLTKVCEVVIRFEDEAKGAGKLNSWFPSPNMRYKKLSVSALSERSSRNPHSSVVFRQEAPRDREIAIIIVQRGKMGSDKDSAILARR
jgi:hypothetical protein